VTERNLLKDLNIDRRHIRVIKRNAEEICLGMDWIDMAQERDKWQALVNTIMYLQVP
jgi:predicted transcriptional regulator